MPLAAKRIAGVGLPPCGQDQEMEEWKAEVVTETDEQTSASGRMRSWQVMDASTCVAMAVERERRVVEQ